jgi:saccharopine dehydrogenase-like NADP-dependent oxidoreductase
VVHQLYSYGGGFPEPDHADDNPLRYKISWSFETLLATYTRPALLLKDGELVSIPGTEIFKSEHIRTIEVPGLGTLEAYPNADAVRFIDLFGIGEHIKDMGRFALRWPGHAALWYALVKLGLLEDEPEEVGEIRIPPRQFLIDHLEPRLQYTENERDVAVLSARARGLKNGKQCQVTYEVVDYRDMETGLFAMNRTVGFMASIGAQMILSGAISEPGVLSPACHVPAVEALKELETRGIRVDRRFTKFP